MLLAGYVCILPHLGHCTGAMKHVAHHSPAIPSKCSPQLSHLNFVVPNTISFQSAMPPKAHSYIRKQERRGDLLLSNGGIAKHLIDLNKRIPTPAKFIKTWV